MLFDRGIYVIRCGRNYKIGVARDIYQRISQFMIGNPIEMEVLIFAKVADAMSTESELHGMYSDARVSGEWFNLKPEDVNDIAKHIGTETISILSSSKEEIKNYRPIQSKDEIEYLAKKEEEYAKTKEMALQEIQTKKANHEKDVKERGIDYIFEKCLNSRYGSSEMKHMIVKNIESRFSIEIGESRDISFGSNSIYESIIGQVIYRYGPEIALAAYRKSMEYNDNVDAAVKSMQKIAKGIKANLYGLASNKMTSTCPETKHITNILKKYSGEPLTQKIINMTECAVNSGIDTEMLKRKAFLSKSNDNFEEFLYNLDHPENKGKLLLESPFG